ncbi:MAG: AMP-binding protein [Anaerolineae bacterium]|nr:AMP-binding protein [Anaerolineae bacterium]
MATSNGAASWTAQYERGVPASLAPYPRQTLQTFLTETARRFPDAPAVLSSAHLPVLGRLKAELTYRQLEDASDALAVALVDMGVKKGDRVALILPNCAQFVIAFHAVLKVGAIVCALNPTFPAAKLRDLLQDCGATTAITLSLFYETVKKVQAETAIRNVIVTNIKEYLPGPAAFLFTLAKERKDGHRIEKRPEDADFQELLRRFAGRRPSVEVGPDDVALFQYTGGTTGVPKAAVVTHQALVCNTLQNRAWIQSAVEMGKETFLCAIPLFHVYGMIAVMSLGLSLGARLVMVVNPRDVHEVVEVIDRYQVSMFVGVPAMCNAIISYMEKHAGQYSLRSVKAGFSGSAPLVAETQTKFEALTSGPLVEGYGLSESPTVVCGNPLRGNRPTGSIGVPYPDVAVRVVSLEDEVSDVALGERGELIIHAPSMMLGYHNMPGETDIALRTGPDGRKWLYTGDIVTLDEHGYLYIVDRKKDMALIGGFNVYPTTVEKVFTEHPAIQEIGIAAIPHPDAAKAGQQMLKAWVVLRERVTVTAQELIAFASEKLARYELPSQIQFVEALPKTLVGKVLRRELVQMELEARERSASHT